MVTTSYILESSTDLSLTERELLYRLGWFTRIRWGIGLAALAILLIGWYGLGVRFARDGQAPTYAPVIFVIVAIFVYNIAFALLARHMRLAGRISRGSIVDLALGQLLLDMVSICVLAHFTGGIENFFLVLVLLPLVIATVLLPKSLAIATAFGAAGLIHAMAWLEQQGVIGHVHAYWTSQKMDLYADPRYVLEVTTALTLAIFGTVFVVSSISQRLRSRESQLGKAYQALRKADEAKSFFMRKAGHEMRAPLAAIHSILEAVVASSVSLEDKHRQLIGRTQDRLDALMELMDDLRRYSRVRSPEGIIWPKKLQFDSLVKDTTNLFAQQAEDKGVKLSCSCQRVEIVGDEQLLQDLVTNLVANSVQYTPSGGSIEVSLSIRRGLAVLNVCDTGVGISPAGLENLFEEFHRSPEARKIQPEGTGLGLAITKRITEMHSGSIDYMPNQTGGAIFTVHLPLKGPQSDQ